MPDPQDTLGADEIDFQPLASPQRQTSRAPKATPAQGAAPGEEIDFQPSQPTPAPPPTPRAPTAAPAASVWERHPVLERMLDVAKERISDPIHAANEGVKAALRDLYEVGTKPASQEERLTPFTGELSSSPEMQDVSTLARRGGRVLADVGQLAAAPFQVLTAPIAPEMNSLLGRLVPRTGNPDVDAINQNVIPALLFSELGAGAEPSLAGTPTVETAQGRGRLLRPKPEILRGSEAPKPAVPAQDEVDPEQAEPTPRPVRGLLPPPQPTPVEAVGGVPVQVRLYPGEEPLVTPEPARTPTGAIRTRPAPQRLALPAPTTPEEIDFLRGEPTPTPRIPAMTAGGLVETRGRAAVPKGEIDFRPAAPEAAPRAAEEQTAPRRPGLTQEEREFAEARARALGGVAPISEELRRRRMGEKPAATPTAERPSPVEFEPATETPEVPKARDPEIRQQAEMMVREAADFLSQQERPGRYRPDISTAIGETREAVAARVQDQAPWTVVRSLRGQFPWFENRRETPSELVRAAARGRGPVWNRLVDAAADYYEERQKAAAPYVQKITPQAKQLAEQVREVDPEMAESLDRLARGYFPTYGSLYDFAKVAQEQLHDAQAAAEFTRAIDELREADRGSAATESLAALSRPSEEVGREEARREEGPAPAHAVADRTDYNEGNAPPDMNDPVWYRGRWYEREELPESAAQESRIIEPEILPKQTLPEWLRAEFAGEPSSAPPAIRGPETTEEAIKLYTQNIRNLEEQLRSELRARDHENAAITREDIAEQKRFLAEATERVKTVETAGGPALPGMEQALAEQKTAAEKFQGEQLAEEFNRPPESIEGIAGEMERKSRLFRGTEASPQQELFPSGETGRTFYTGVDPTRVRAAVRMLSRAWEEKVARPFIDRVLKIGDKYQKAGEIDPTVAEGLHLLDNAPSYLRAKVAQEVHNVIGNLSRAQERLFVLMADAESRRNLRANHAEEYRQAQYDPAIQEALRRYRPLEQELTELRHRMGGAIIEDDYLRRVYDKYVAGVGHAEAPGMPERGTSAYDRVIRPQRIGNVAREAEAEYHYRNGLHEFGPAFATKYIATHLRALRDQIAREFMGKATFVPAGASEPRFILYGGERYYRPDIAAEMRTGTKVYDRYDPTAGEKFPVPADGRFLGPRELVKALNDFGRREEGEPGALRRFFQEQIIGFGFGIPHIANIMRRVSQTVSGAALNPKGWVEAWRVVLSKELRSRGIAGLNDPTFDMLAQRGAISTGEWANLKEYWGGSLNPANWARSLAQIGHRVLFEPGSMGGFGGVDQRARLYITDLVKSQRPGLTDSEIARAVRDQLGDYNRANWSDRQKMLGRFMMFPGWDFSSIRWVLQHPVKTTVPPALLVLLANQALHQLGKNRPEDQYDIHNIHVGDRAFGLGLVREPVARNLFRPALAYAQAKVRGQSDQRAMAEASRGVTAGAGGLLSMLRPDLSGFLAIATNRRALFSGKELVSRDDFAQPGKVLPSRAIEKEAVFVLRHAIPALDRMLDGNEDIDLRSFAGGNLGVPNYRDDAERRLYRNTAEAEEVRRTITRLAKSDPELARRYVRDPDNAAFALFYNDFKGLVTTLKRMDEAKQRIEGSGLPSADKKARIAAIDKARENLLQHADGLGNLLFERRQGSKQPVELLRPGFLRQRQLQPTAEVPQQ